MIRELYDRLKGIIFRKVTPSMEDDFDDMEYLPMEFKLTVVERPSKDKLKIRHKKWK